LPWFELLLGLWLVAGVALRYAAGLASAVLLGFFAVMLRAYFKGMTIDCGCFGFGEALGPATLTRDGVLVLLSLALFWAAVRTARSPHTEAAAS
jgi:hypothetical protein